MRAYRHASRVAIAVEEVQGQERGWSSGRADRCFEHLGDSLVQLAAAAVRKPLVRDVAEQGITETEPAGTIGDEQPVEPGCGRAAVRIDDRGEQGLVERVAQHGRMAQVAARRGGEPVDLGRYERVDGVREPTHPARGRGLTSELREESRVAARPVDQQLDFVGVKGLRLRREPHELRVAESESGPSRSTRDSGPEA